MLTALLSLGALIFATSETTASPQGNESFLRGLLELGFKEVDGTVDKFLNGDSHLELEIVDPKHISCLTLIFTHTNNYYCTVIYGYVPTDYKASALDGQDDGLDYQGHADCETAVAASLAVMEEMIGGASKGISLLKS